MATAYRNRGAFLVEISFRIRGPSLFAGVFFLCVVIFCCSSFVFEKKGKAISGSPKRLPAAAAIIKETHCSCWSIFRPFGQMKSRRYLRVSRCPRSNEMTIVTVNRKKNALNSVQSKLIWLCLTRGKRNGTRRFCVRRCPAQSSDTHVSNQESNQPQFDIFWISFERRATICAKLCQFNRIFVNLFGFCCFFSGIYRFKGRPSSLEFRVLLGTIVCCSHSLSRCSGSINEALESTCCETREFESLAPQIIRACRRQSIAEGKPKSKRNMQGIREQ